MKAENYCTYQFINSKATVVEKCRELATACDFNYFDLIRVNFCSYNDSKAVTIVVALLIVIFCFYFIANTANKYLAPMLGIISEKMKLSQNLAGLTLLALGNQAPDVLVAIISGEDEEEGIAMSLGAVLGSNLMILHIVLSTVVLLGNKFEVVPSNYVRDFSVYLFALLIVLLFGLLREIVLWESIMFFLLYFLYVALCFFMDKKGAKDFFDKESFDLVNDISQDYEVTLFQDDFCVVTQRHSNLKEEVEPSYVVRDDLKESIPIKREVRTTYSVFFSRFQYGLVSNYLRWSETEWASKSNWQKVVYSLFEFPFDIIRDLTIPPFEKQKWNRPMFLAMPFTIPLLLIGIFRMEKMMICHWPYFIGFFALMVILFIVAYRTTYRNSLPKYEWLLLLIGCLITLCWLWGVSNILLDMVKVIKMLLPIEISQVFFTLTLVSLGNALPDFFNNCALAKKGYAEMAYSGSIGSPVFGLLFGFGLSMIKTNITTPRISFNIYDLSLQSNLILLCALICLVTNLIRLLIEGFVLRFEIKKCSSAIGYAFYAAFLACICYFTFK